MGRIDVADVTAACGKASQSVDGMFSVHARCFPHGRPSCTFVSGAGQLAISDASPLHRASACRPGCRTWICAALVACNLPLPRIPAAAPACCRLPRCRRCPSIWLLSRRTSEERQRRRSQLPHGEPVAIARVPGEACWSFGRLPALVPAYASHK
jgi:hypothetical protein